MKLLIVGCGYVGLEVAKQWQQRISDGVVYALTRTDARVEELGAQNIVPVVGDWLSGEFDLPDVDLILVAVPHRPVAEFGEMTHVQGLEHLLGRLKNPPGRLIYLSTTGVYGSQEETVNEDTPAKPTREGPALALAAENWLRSTSSSISGAATILRLAGIYGPGRIPLAAKLRAGESLAVPREGHLNLVHVADIAQVICLMLERKMQHSVYVLSDGHPVIRETFYRKLARLCGVESPEFADPPDGDPRLRRTTDKRVDPGRIIGELAYEFRFPDYSAGLDDALKA